MIQNVENLGAELNVEFLRNSLDVVVLEHGEVKRRDAGTDQDVPARISAKVEAAQISRRQRAS